MQNLVFKLLIIIIFSSTVTFTQEGREIMERIQTVKKVKLLDVLDLDESTSEKLLLKYNSFENRTQELLKEFDEVEEKLEDAIREKNSSEIKRLTEEFLKVKASIVSLSDERDGAIKKILTPEKFATYLLFEKRFRKELSREIIKRGRNRRNF